MDHLTRGPDSLPTATAAHLTFEQALITLEQTVDELRSEGLDLSRALDLYDQGQQLASYCERLLTEAELRLTRVDEVADGSSGRDSRL
jgi:exodeoxyribonuclease VII small subunit